MRSNTFVDRVGVSHVAGKYCFTEKDYLNEGADELLSMGCRVIKVWFMEDSNKSYPFNSHWPKVKTLVDVAKTPYFKALFDKPFKTFILETYAPGREDHYYLEGMSKEQIAREFDDLYSLTKHLLTTYQGSGKTFIIQNWEGDWSLRGGAPGKEPSQQNIDGMIAWFNARQDGVERARSEVKASGVTVLHAAEVNLVGKAMKHDGKSVTNDVLPQTHCDLYSYSAYDVSTSDRNQFRAALDYLASKSPPSKLFGHQNVYIGEYGAPENDVGGADVQLQRMKSATEIALDWGALYVIYWELYCNEPKHKLTARPTNADMRGFWLIRPDGSHAPVADYFQMNWRSSP